MYSYYYVPLLLFYVFIAVVKHNITEAYGAQARCYEHSDECNSTVSFSCLATQLVQHSASGQLAYYINTDGKHMCYYCQQYYASLHRSRLTGGKVAELFCLGLDLY